MNLTQICLKCVAFKQFDLRTVLIILNICNPIMFLCLKLLVKQLKSYLFL